MKQGVNPSTVAAVAKLLAGAKSALFITGAGLSQDSGLPTYRGVGGLYEARDTTDGIPIEEALSGPMFRKRPELVWKYLDQIGKNLLGARPNRGHEVIAELERRMSRVWTLTQNVDAFHGQAGSHNVIEIHGDVHRLHCTMCPHRELVLDWSELDIPPDCPQCASVLRPEVVLFGEMLPDDAIRTLNRELDRGFDVVLSIGTSSLFPYIAEPVLMAERAGIPTVEINPGVTDISDVVTHKLSGRAAPVLDAILDAYLGLLDG
ncbi:MAG: NAD-dependent protein deacylase [Deltaproteobacteria bacterium]|nr:MAG: NAD-dependent protein deacylase [Deltaproteobacteria bacterium]